MGNGRAAGVPIADLLDKNCFSEGITNITDWKLRHTSTNTAVEALGSNGKNPEAVPGDLFPFSCFLR